VNCFIAFLVLTTIIFEDKILVPAAVFHNIAGCVALLAFRNNEQLLSVRSLMLPIAAIVEFYCYLRLVLQRLTNEI